MIVYGRTHTYYAESCISAKCEMLKYLDFKMITPSPPRPRYNPTGKWDTSIKTQCLSYGSQIYYKALALLLITVLIKVYIFSSCALEQVRQNDFTTDDTLVFIIHNVG